jgi:hypothetical protein
MEISPRIVGHDHTIYNEVVSAEIAELECCLTRSGKVRIQHGKKALSFSVKPSLGTRITS